MKKILLPLLLLSLSIFSTQNINAQNNVGIGTTTPNAEAILDLDPSSALGLLMPRLVLNDTNSFSTIAANDGMIFYATDINAFVYYDASTTYWTQVGSGAGGSAGADGLTTLITATPEAPGANCTDGGQRIDLGLDDNDDAVLQGGEIDNTFYVCNGADGLDGDQYATNSTSSLTIALGAQSFTVGPGLAYTPGQTVIIANSGTDFMEGSVTSYVSGTGAMNVNVTNITGGGTFASWSVNLAGAPGPAGANGLNSLANSTVEAPGANCADGGQRIDVGLDDNDDGILQAGEIDNTYYVCDGAVGATGAVGAAGPAGTNGVDGLNSLATSTVEAPGVNCTDGGQRIDVGLDANADLILQPGEISSTYYICDGAAGPAGAAGVAGANGIDGLNSLANSTVEAPGVNCADGGQRIDVGLDDNDDGILQAGEIDNTYYVCDGAAGPASLQAAYDGGQTINMGTGNIDFISSVANSVLYVDEGNERIGIGNASPTFKLDLSGGNLNIDASSAYLQGGGHLISQVAASQNVYVGGNTNAATGANNTVVGFDAGNTIGAGADNTVMGFRAGQTLGNGNSNTMIGKDAGNQSFNTSNNTFIGELAGEANFSGQNNTMVGRNTGASSISGNAITLLGSGTNATNGLTNATAIGAGAVVGASNALVLGNGATSVGIGTQTPANKLEVIGDAAKFDSVIIVNGAQVGYVLTAADATGAASWQPLGAGTFWDLTGNAGTVDGTNFLGTTDAVALNFRMNNQPSGRIDDAASGYTGFGFQSGNNGAGVNNTAFGFRAMASNTADGNTAIGSLAMENNAAFAANTGIGYAALRNIAGVQNTAIGNAAMENSTTGDDNVAVGFLALLNTDADGNTAIGSRAMINSITGINNVAVGYNSLSSTTADNNTALGAGALAISTTGSGNTAVGQNSMVNNLGGQENTAVGLTALFNNTSGNQNTGLGFDALFSNTTGSNNVGVGWRAGFDLDGGSNNVFIGYDANTTNANLQNSTAIGFNAIVSQDNSIVLGDISNTRVGIGTSAPVNTLDVIATGRTAIYAQTDGLNSGDYAISAINNGGADVAGYFYNSNPAGGVNSHGIYTASEGAGSGIYAAVQGVGTGSGAIFDNFNAANTSAVVRIQNSGGSGSPALVASGAVGLGTTNPTQLLHLSGGTIRLEDFAGNGRQILTVNNTGVVGFTDLADSVFWTANGNDIYNKNSGNVGIGTANPSQTLHVASEGLGSTSNMILEGHSVASTRGPGIDIRRSRGSILTPSIVSNGDFLGAVNFYGFGTAFRESANITVLADGAISGTSVPGRLAFSTTNAGFAFASEKMTILSNGNVGIGTTTPVYRLSVNGTANLNEGIASGVALRVNGAEALWYDGTYFSWGFGGTANFFDDNVGLGTTTPVNRLDVEGGAAIGAAYSGTSIAPANGLIVQGEVGIGTNSPDETLTVGGPIGYGWAVPAVSIGSATGTGGLVIGSTINNFSIDHGNTFNRARITSSDAGGFGQGEIEFRVGGIGINTSTPQNDLDVEGSVAIGAVYSGSFSAQPNGLIVEENVGIGYNGASDLYQLRIDIPSTNSTTPYGQYVNNDYSGTSAKYGIFVDVSVDGTGTKAGLWSNVYGAAGSSQAAYGARSFVNHAGTGAVYGNFIDANKAVGQSGTLYGQYVVSDNDGSGDSYLMFASSVGTTSGTEYGLYVTGEDVNYFSSNVGIGTTAPTSILEVVDNISGTMVEIRNTNTGTNSDGINIQLGAENSSNDFIYFTGSTGLYRGRISHNGAGGVAYNTASDRRLKENIKDFKGGLNLVLSMKPKTYNFIGFEQSETGFIAQELVQIIPTAVNGDSTLDVKEEPMMVDYSKLTPILTSSVQELHKMIIDQQNQIDELTAKLSDNESPESHEETITIDKNDYLKQQEELKALRSDMNELKQLLLNVKK